MKALVQLRRAPTLSVDYEDHWASLKSKASKLIDVVSKKCLRIQAAALKRHLRILHSSEKSTRPLLYLANAPFYAESDYVFREAKVFKMLKEKVLKQQEESKARENYLIQRQIALEETVKQQSELLKKQSKDITRIWPLSNNNSNPTLRCTPSLFFLLICF